MNEDYDDDDDMLDYPITPVQVENLFDLGYFGVQNDFPILLTVKCVLPVRKKKNSIVFFQMKRELTTENIHN
jgi:hypothetical protein